jgi:aspartate kinase
MGGFMGATVDGVTTTLGRGGSDYTASIVGSGIDAEEIQIWTDVDGMLTCDPTILEGGYRVKACSFAEAAELAYFGAKVLHPATVLPAIEKNIPVRILNSRRPESEGTLIAEEAPDCADPIRSIACKRNITLVNIVSTRMLMAHGFLRRIFEVFVSKRRWICWRPPKSAYRSPSTILARWRRFAPSLKPSPMLGSKNITRSCAWWVKISAGRPASPRGFSARYGT